MTKQCCKTCYAINRHIDTARMYQCEGAVGKGILNSGVARDDIWLTSKLDNCDHAPDRVAKACREQLRDLQTDYLDLYLIHWPLTGKAGPTLEPPIKVTCLYELMLPAILCQMLWS